MPTHTLERSLMQNPLLWSCGVVVGALFLVMFFRLMPAYEIHFSSWFFTQSECGGDSSKVRCGRFFSAVDKNLIMLRVIGLRLPQLFASAVAVWLVWLAFFKADKTSLDLMKPTHGLLSMILGPALLTNVIFKPFWGRPRPVQTVEFGGEAPYVLAGDISEHCVGNCSFVSGEATAAFWMVWIIPFLPSKWRWLGGVLIVALACGISLLRVVFGGHFLSDVMLGGMVALFAITLSALIIQSPGVMAQIDRWRDFSNRHSFVR
ncbi:MAG: phosphatase PAP2 family protein [Rhizobiaceae bacterium]